MTVDRRRFLGFSVAAAAALGPARAFALAKPRVVILGGGAGGASLAFSLRRLGGTRADITLVEQNPAYVSCFFSNWVIGGLRSMDDITHRYDTMAGAGIAVVNARAEAIDREGKALVLADGSRVPYDRLVLAPGIDFDYGFLPGYGEGDIETAPHAWKAGPQTVLLKAKLDALSDGATIVMTVPNNPYRCPPGPYERASMFAHVLKTKGHTRSKIVILDGKEKFSKQAVFQEGWEAHFPGMVEWLPPSIHGGLERAAPADGTVTTALDSFKGDLLTIIPPQKAGAIARSAGLVGEDGWCPVVAETLTSTIDPAITVIGDAVKAGEMPKSAFSANNQAKAATIALLSDLFGRTRTSPRYFNTCWSLITPQDGVKVGAIYDIKDKAIAARVNFASQPGEDATERAKSVVEAEAWYASITNEMFG